MHKLSLFSQFFKGQGPQYALGIVLLIIIDILFLFVPRLTGSAIETLAHNKEGLTHYILYILLIGLVITAAKFASRHLLLGSVRKLEFGLRRKLFNHALYIPTSYYEKNGPGKVMALMTNDVTSLRVSLGLGVMIFIDAIFFGICSFFIMAKEISLSLALITIGPMPLIIVLMVIVSRRMRSKQRDAQSTYSDLTEYTQELFLGIHIIRSFNEEQRSFQQFKDNNQLNYKKNMTVALLDSLLAPLTYIAPFICYAISIYVCGKLIIANQLTIGDFVAVNGYLILIIGPLMGIGSLASVLQKGLASLDRLTDFLDLPEEPRSTGVGEVPLTDISIRNLSFVYPESTMPALTIDDETIKAGQFIGLVGGPGSGKSTLFKLLMRLQKTPTNSIFIGDEDLMSLPLDQLRRSVAYVPPEAYILGTTIKENIVFGEENAHHLDFEETLEKAALVRDLKDRIDDNELKLKERGDNLSGGQKQRINIARGLYKNAPYLLLDDSISALDTESAQTIIKTLRTNQKQTLLFISQRLEALQEADQIWVFKNGKIVEKGTSAELLSAKGEYYKLYAQQLEQRGGDE